MCFSDVKLKEFDDELKVVCEFLFGGVVLMYVVYSVFLYRLFVFTANGGVRVYKILFMGEYVEFIGYGKFIILLKLSYDEIMLYSVGDDGCLFMYDVKFDAVE